LFPEGTPENGKARQQEPGRPGRLLVGTVALGAAALGLSSCGSPASTVATDEAPSNTAVVECSSGTITDGDIQMSALTVTKVPAGEQPDVPGGCTVQTG
jgi:hypothetical protein